MVWLSSLNIEMKIFSWLHIRVRWFLEPPPTYLPYSLYQLCPLCVSKWKACGKYLTPFASCWSSISSCSPGCKSLNHLHCFLEQHKKKKSDCNIFFICSLSLKKMTSISVLGFEWSKNSFPRIPHSFSLDMVPRINTVSWWKLLDENLGLSPSGLDFFLIQNHKLVYI